MFEFYVEYHWYYINLIDQLYRNVAVALERKLDNPPPDALGRHKFVYNTFLDVIIRQETIKWSSKKTFWNKTRSQGLLYLDKSKDYLEIRYYMISQSPTYELQRSAYLLGWIKSLKNYIRPSRFVSQMATDKLSANKYG